jgi:hypothetical protein
MNFDDCPFILSYTSSVILFCNISHPNLSLANKNPFSIKNFLLSYSVYNKLKVWIAYASNALIELLCEDLVLLLALELEDSDELLLESRRSTYDFY